MHSGITQIKVYAWYIGMAGLAASCWMTGSFGWSMTIGHALMFVLVTLMAPIAITFGDHLLRNRSYTSGGLVLSLGILFAVAEYGSHLGYVIGARTIDTEVVTVQNANHAETRDAIADDRKNLGMWREQLVALQAIAPWAATVKAEALRDQLTAAEKAVELESGRGGCKSKCQALMADKGKLAERIGQVEQMADLSKRIEATQRLLDGKREVSAKTEFRHSKVVSQTAFVSQLVTGSLEPDAKSRNWAQIGIGAFIALVSTIVPIAAFFIAFSDRQTSASHSAGNASAASEARSRPAVPSPVHPLHTREIVRTDSGVWSDLNKAMQHMQSSRLARAA
jgi:hypothetical protein